MTAPLGWTGARRYLLGLGEALGIPTSAWPAFESLEVVQPLDHEVPRSVVERLNLDAVREAAAFFRGALRGVIHLDHASELVLSAALTQDDIDAFLHDTAGSPVFSLDLTLNKEMLIAAWWGARPDCRSFLFLFEEALEAFLARDVLRIERDFFLDPRQRKTILILVDRDLFLDGPHLTLVGGSGLLSWDTIAPTAAEDLERVRSAYETCRRQSNWQQAWVQQITPFHLALEYPEKAIRPLPQLAAASRIVDLVDGHFANLSLLYLAQRSENRGQGRVATFASASRTVEIPLRTPSSGLLEPERLGIPELLRVIAWTYDEHRTGSRFALVQDTIVRELLAVSDNQRYGALLQRAATIMTQLNWRWQAFIGEKVDDYLSQVREFEDDVEKTVQAFADQLGALTKGLTDTMLGAVAAVVGVLVASVIKEKFNPLLFTLGITAYALYVAIFHLGYGLTYQKERFGALQKDFVARKNRFSERVPTEQVEHVIGSRIADSETRWNNWYNKTKSAYYYLLVALGAIIAIALVIGLVGVARSNWVVAPTPVPMTPTP